MENGRKSRVAGPFSIGRVTGKTAFLAGRNIAGTTPKGRAYEQSREILLPQPGVAGPVVLARLGPGQSTTARSQPCGLPRARQDEVGRRRRPAAPEPGGRSVQAGPLCAAGGMAARQYE